MKIAVMPYRTNAELPEPVRVVLPKHAQDIFREAFNHAYENYAHSNKRNRGGTREGIAYRVAWAAVKKAYHKQNERWVRL